MPIDDQWERLGPEDWRAFAQAWISELRSTDLSDRVEGADVGQSVVMMNFTATAKQQWQFILAAVEFAGDEELGHVAAGPVEHLLGKHGEAYIDEVEREAEFNPKLARMLLGVLRHGMTDEVWRRIEDTRMRFAE
jgi:hypothetical protein